MEKLSEITERLMLERFGNDVIIALATSDGFTPFVRNVNAFYEGGAFFVLTYALSSKMLQIAKNPLVAVAGEWFSAHGNAVDLGFFGKPENKAVADRMKVVFSSWLDNGHCDLNDVNTCILRIDLTDGVLFSHGTRYDIDFT